MVHNSLCLNNDLLLYWTMLQNQNLLIPLMQKMCQSMHFSVVNYLHLLELDLSWAVEQIGDFYIFRVDNSV